MRKNEENKEKYLLYINCYLFNNNRNNVSAFLPAESIIL